MYYYVYIVTNRSKTLYTGVTSNLPKPVWQHRERRRDFTSCYKIDTLVYYERFGDVLNAIARERSRSRTCGVFRSWR